MRQLTIRKMLSTDVKAVVKVHQVSFPGFFLSSLGSKFLSLFYSTALVQKDAIAYVAQDEYLVVKGFVLGSGNPQGFYKRLLTGHWLSFALCALPSVLKSPNIAPRLIRAFAYPSTQTSNADCAGLYSIGVDPLSAGNGVGSSLLTTFVTHAKSIGCRSISLTTDAMDNDYANGFYTSNGFVCASTYVTKESRKMNVYVKSLI